MSFSGGRSAESTNGRRFQTPQDSQRTGLCPFVSVSVSVSVPVSVSVSVSMSVTVLAVCEI